MKVTRRFKSASDTVKSRRQKSTLDDVALRVLACIEKRKTWTLPRWISEELSIRLDDVYTALEDLMKAKKIDRTFNFEVDGSKKPIAYIIAKKTDRR